MVPLSSCTCRPSAATAHRRCHEQGVHRAWACQARPDPRAGCFVRRDGTFRGRGTRPNSALLCLLPVDDWRRRHAASPEGAASLSTLLELPEVLDLERIPIELELARSYAPLTLDTIYDLTWHMGAGEATFGLRYRTRSVPRSCTTASNAKVVLNVRLGLVCHRLVQPSRAWAGVQR